MGSLSLYSPLAVRSCAIPAKASCAPSSVPALNADIILSLMSGVIDLFGNLPRIPAIGNTSVIPITPPINSDIVSAPPPTSSPIALAA